MANCVQKRVNDYTILKSPNTAGCSTEYEKRERQNKIWSKINKKKEKLIQTFWVNEQNREEMNAYIDKNRQYSSLCEWENSADKKNLRNRVQFEIDKVLEKEEEELIERKKRLKELFETENKMYVEEEEVENIPPSHSERISTMLERYKKIMTDKELERRKIAEAKKELQFRRDCDELRSLVSKKICELVTKEGKALAQMRTEIDDKNDIEEQLYNEMWLKDIEAKKMKEIEEASLNKGKSKEYAMSLKDQMKNELTSKEQMKYSTLAKNLLKTKQAIDKQMKSEQSTSQNQTRLQQQSLEERKLPSGMEKNQVITTVSSDGLSPDQQLQETQKQSSAFENDWMSTSASSCCCSPGLEKDQMTSYQQIQETQKQYSGLKKDQMITSVSDCCCFPDLERGQMTTTVSSGGSFYDQQLEKERKPCVGLRKNQLQHKCLENAIGNPLNELQIAEERRRLFEIEEEWERSQKKIKQENLKQDLDRCLKDKVKRMAHEFQENLMSDLHFMNDLIDKDKGKKQAEEKKKS